MRGSSATLVREGRVLTPEGWRVARLEADGPRISSVCPLPTREDEPQWPRIVPGFVDLHCHGSDGIDVMAAHAPEAWEQLSRGLARHGVTAFLATVLTAPLDVMVAVAPPTVELAGAQCIGVHWEGPYLAPGWAGAQPRAWLRPPDPAEFGDVLGTRSLALVTLAPELPGALRLIGMVRAQGGWVNVGHSGATYEDAGRAFDAGADGVTHAFNAMPPWHHRRPSLLAQAIDTPTVWIEAITDGVHLHPATVRLLGRAAPGRIVGVTDASRLAGTSEPEGDLGGHPVLVRDGAAWLARQPDTLAASVLTADQGVANLIRWGWSWDDAVHAWSSAPAQRMGFHDRGRLAVGARADWVVLSDDVQVRETVVGGRVVYRADERTPARHPSSPVPG
ncbi:MAG: amidohydrolase family protein [Thermaerobacter sp.]|nr:amidohydrolase family protein [Thermaerobacter sp.]